MQRTPEYVELFTILLNPETPNAEIDASAAMIAAMLLGMAGGALAAALSSPSLQRDP